MAAVTHDELAATVGRGSTGGLGVALVSAASFGLSGPLARGLIEAGWSPAAAVLARIAIAAVVLAVPVLRAVRGRWRLVRDNAGLITAYGVVAVAGCQLAYFSAVARMPVALALLIEYLSPTLVIGWLWARHGQRPGRLTVLGAVVAFAGLVLVLGVLSGVSVDLVGVSFALMATVGGAAYFILSAHDSALPPMALAGGGLTVGAVVLAVAGALGLVPLTASTAAVNYTAGTFAWWVPLAALGVVTAALAYVSGVAATRRLGSRLASFVALAEVLFSLLFAGLLLHEWPGTVQLAGGVLILGGVLLVKLGEPRGRGPVVAEAV